MNGSTRNLTSATLAGCDDRILFGLGGRPTKVDIDGGAGHDHVEVFSSDSTTRIDVDLQRGRYDLQGGPKGKVKGFEDAEVNGGRVRLAGTAGANTLVATTCLAGRIDAGRGDDLVSIVRSGRRRCNPGTTPEVFGGAGSDSLSGSRVGDLLVGGPGRDSADGAGGRDTCVSVKIRSSCARR